MGDDVTAARRFGRRGVTIRWVGATPLPSVGAGAPKADDQPASILAETELR